MLRSKREGWVSIGAVLASFFLSQSALAQSDACTAPPADPSAPFENAVWAGGAAHIAKVDVSTGSAALETVSGAAVAALAVDKVRHRIWSYDATRTIRAYDFEGSPGASFSGPAVDPICGLLGYAGRQHLAIDERDASLWVGDCTRTLRYSATGTLLGESSAGGKVRAIAVDEERARRWTATDTTLRAYDDAGTQLVEITAGLLEQFMDVSLDESSGDVWLAVRGAVGESGLRVYTASGALRFSVPIVNLTAVATDGSGAAWAATDSELLRVDAAGAIAASVAPFGASGSVKALIADDRDGTVWVTNGTSLVHLGLDGAQDLAATLASTSEIATLAFYADTVAPQAEIVAPVAGALLNTSRPNVEVDASDDASGVNFAGTCIGRAGEALETACTASATGITCALAEDLPEGENTLVVHVYDGNANTAEPASVTFNIDSVAPNPVDTSAVSVTANGDGTATVTGGAGAAQGGASIKIRNRRTGEVVIVTANADGSFEATINALPQDVLELSVTDSAGNTSAIRIVPVGTANPADVAPPLDPTTPTNFAAAVEFLYSGSHPVQTGVAPGTMDPERVAVLRGLVVDADGAGVGGVEVYVPAHPELGQTVTRADGRFDFAVNGGGVIVVETFHPSYLRTQRQVDVPWRQFLQVPDVVLVERDPVVTTVDLGSPAPMQTARGSQETDADGTRQATALFPQGTQATMVMPDGTTQALSSLSVRATEYTVGPDGPMAMPAPLPPTSAYTYAVELSIDEADQAGAVDVQFDRAVPFYVENFLSFPVGTVVPVGYYDRQAAEWVPSANGRVIKIVGISGGLAQIDTNGDGVAESSATLAALGITDPERAKLATLYAVGQTLWRAPIQHFTPWDLNWPRKPPDGATGPGGNPPPGGPDQPSGSDSPDGQGGAGGDWPDQQSCENGSIIRCEQQVLGEAIPIAGTNFTLHYQSDRVPGYKVNDSIQIPLSGTSLPSGITRIDLQVSVAGKETIQSFPAATNQTTTFQWDGTDAYGRPVQGLQPVSIRIGYVYDAVYAQPDQFEQSFAGFSGVPMTGNPARDEVTLWTSYRRMVGKFSSAGMGLAGWSLNAHHVYDPAGHVLYEGNGNRRSAIGVTRALSTIAGTGSAGFNGDGIDARAAQLNDPRDVELGPDGSIYIADPSAHRVRRISPDGIISTVAGNGTRGLAGDGGPATSAQLALPFGIAFGPDGALYIAEHDGHRIRRVAPDGMISTLAGSPTCMGHGCEGFSGDGGPATAAKLGFPYAVDVGPDGSVYFADHHNNRIRRVGTDGVIKTVAGIGSWGFTGDGGPATSARLAFPVGLVVGADGSFYFPDRDNDRIRKVGPDGIIRTIAGGCRGTQGDGGPATSACLAFWNSQGEWSAAHLTLSPDGSLFFGEALSHRVRRISPNGIITTVAGTGFAGFDGDGGTSTGSRLTKPIDAAVAPDGAVLVTDGGNKRIRRVALPFSGFNPDGYVIPAEDGFQVHEFDEAGRHLSTRHALTGAVMYSFEYDGDGRLESISDGDGNVTTIERNGSGGPAAIAAPFGQRTTLTLDVNGYLAVLRNPESKATSFTYDTLGLMKEMHDANGNGPFEFAYDPLGRLIRDDDPAGGSQEFSRQALASPAKGYEVIRTTAQGRTKKYKVETKSTGQREQTTIYPDGTQQKLVVALDSTETTTYPDGSIERVTKGPDPRFSLQAPLATRVVVTQPSSLASVTTFARTVSLSSPDDPLSLTSLTETTVVNGRTFTNAYNPATRRFTLTTPTARQVLSTIDLQGRLLETEITGLEKTTYGYDAKGRLQTISRGTGADERTFTLVYHPTSGFLESITDPLGRATSYVRDMVGQVTSQTLPGNRTIGFTYDPNGNLASLTPPGRTAHSFLYTPVNLASEYDPPDIGGPDTTVYSHSLDRDLELVTRPDGQTIDLVYGTTNGRLSSIVTPTGTKTFGYNATTGKLTSISAPGNQNLAYTYDGSLLVTETWSGAVSGSLSRTYDTSFRVSTLSVNGANPITFSYDADDLLTGAGSETITRHPQHGLITATTLGAVADSWSYNGFGELSSYTATANSAPIFSTSYTRDTLGRIVTKTETIDLTTDTYTYHYDPAGRLESVEQNGVEVSRYSYDENGNRESYVGTLGEVTEAETSYDAQDRLTAYGDATYTYTANGELATKTDGSGTTTYTYDLLGNLITVELPDGTDIEYVIDGRNRRVGKKVNGTLVQRFLYQDQLKPVAELDGAGNFVSRFVYGSKANVPDYLIKGGTTYRIVSDHLGSPRLVVDSTTGAVVQRVDYDEFGSVIEDTNPGFQPFEFAGGIRDSHTRLVRFGVRDYAPVIGRWTAKDPILFNGDGPNLYSYVLGDPVNLIDPSGYESSFLKRFLQALAFAAMQYFSREPPPEIPPQPPPIERPIPAPTPRPGGSGLGGGGSTSPGLYPFMLPIPSLCAAFPDSPSCAGREPPSDRMSETQDDGFGPQCPA